MRFEKGQKVVALKTWEVKGSPEEGKTYTVRGYSEWHSDCIKLEGILIREDNGGEHVWHEIQFAPLSDIKAAETAVNELVKELEVETYQLN